MEPPKPKRNNKEIEHINKQRAQELQHTLAFAEGIIATMR